MYMYIPMEATQTTPSPSARGPPHLRYLSLGAQAAVRLSPPTTPAVYRAARDTSGPAGREVGEEGGRLERRKGGWGEEGGRLGRGGKEGVKWTEQLGQR